MIIRFQLDAVSADRQIATLTRPEQISVHPGDHVEIRIDKRWSGGNRARIIELLPSGFRGEVCRENRRARYNAIAILGIFDVPYSAIEARIY